MAGGPDDERAGAAASSPIAMGTSHAGVAAIAAAGGSGGAGDAAAEAGARGGEGAESALRHVLFVLRW